MSRRLDVVTKLCIVQAGKLPASSQLPDDSCLLVELLSIAALLLANVMSFY